MFSHQVLATSSTKEERFYLEDMQEKVAHILDLQHINSTLVNSVMEETGGLGVDIIIDAGGKGGMAMGSVKDTSNSGGRVWKHIFDHQVW